MTARKKPTRKPRKRREAMVTPIYLFGDIDEPTALEVYNAIADEKPSTRIRLVINSQGGEVGAADALMDLISRRPVETMGTGICCSAAAELLAAGIKGKRVVTPRTRIMIHKHNYRVTGSHADHESMRAIQDWIDESAVEFWTRASNLDAGLVGHCLLRDTDTWLTPDEALDFGIIDGVLK